MKISTRLTALLLALLMLLSIIATAETAYDPGSMTPEQWQALVENAQKELFTVDEGGVPVPTAPPADPVITDYHPYTDAVSAALGMGEEPVTLTMPASGVAVLSCSAQGQWQMELDGMWVAISGADASELWVSAAMMNGLSTANFRKALADGACTQTASVTLTADQPTALTAQPKASAEEASAPVLGQSARATDPYDLDAANAGLTRYIIQINYLIANGEGKEDTQAASPRIYQIGENSAMNYTFDLPAITGYAPDTSATNLPEGFSISDNGKVFHINLEKVTENITVNVYYEPIPVTYTVKYYKQNADDDDYTLDEGATLTLEGKTGSTIKSNYPENSSDQYFAALVDYEGFLPLVYNDTVTIAADGSTVVPVYFVRLYYLLGLKLQGGTGAEPVYAKYGSKITVTEPTRAGYNFAGWATTESGKDDNGNSTIKPLPSTMPIGGATYYAQWTEGTTSYRVVYWLENADDDNYSILGTETHTAITNTTVLGSSYTDPTFSSAITDADGFIGKNRMVFNSSKTDTSVVVASDGSSILNVYFDRKEYKLKFYYAMTNGTATYINTSSTYYFGYRHTHDSLTKTATTTELELLGQYWNMISAQLTAVTLPTLTSEAAAANKYTTGIDTNRNYKYYYLQFTRKFGADLTGLWPYDALSPAYNNNGKVATVAGWNGEYNVRYSRENSNETVKGFYNKLDEQLMWVDTEPTDNTICFLAYWERNPALYRYNVWLPLREGQDSSSLTTTEHENVTYYLHDSYDTVDSEGNENGEQTPPAISGYTLTTYTRTKAETIPTGYKAAWDFHFYYASEKYTLTFVNADGQQISATKHSMGDSLASYSTTVPDLPNSWDPNSATFEGWYTSSVFTPGTKFDFTGATMPAANLILYANWTPNTYTVRAYVTKAEAEAAKESEEKGEPYLFFENVEHGNATSSKFVYSPDNPNHYDPDKNEFTPPTNGEWTFTHWYYIKDGEEKIFDFTSTPITADTYVYAGWRADKIVEYTIYYVLEGTTDHTDKAYWVADPTTGSDLAGHSVTVEAAQGSSSLYEAYASGYFPTVQSASFTLDVDEDNNVYVFKYTHKATVPYTVYHLTEKNPGTNLGTYNIDDVTYYHLTAPVTHADNDKAVVTENYFSYRNYIPDAFQKRLVVSTNEDDNVIIFFYEQDETKATLEVNHYLLAPGADDPVLYDTRGSIVTLTNNVYSETISELSIANYKYSYATRADDDHAAGRIETLAITINEGISRVVVNLYYERITADLVISKVVEGAAYTSAPASDTFTITVALTGEDVVGTYEYTITSANKSSDPAKLSSTDKTFTISGVKAGDAITIKDIPTGTTFSVSETNNTSYSEVISPQSGTIAETGNNVTVTNTYLTGTLIISKNATGGNSDESFIFSVSGPNGDIGRVSIKGSGSITLTNLPLGTYTVTETNWSYRYSVEGDAARTTTLSKSKLTDTLTFSNNRTNDKWLHDEDSKHNDFRTNTN